MSKRLRDPKIGQKEILRLVENLSFKVDTFSNIPTEQGCSTVNPNEVPADELERSDETRNVSLTW